MGGVSEAEVIAAMKKYPSLNPDTLRFLARDTAKYLKQRLGFRAARISALRALSQRTRTEVEIYDLYKKALSSIFGARGARKKAAERARQQQKPQKQEHPCDDGGQYSLML